MNPSPDAHSETPPPAPKRAGKPVLPVAGVFVPTGEQWHGITWQDVPGRDDPTKKLNFTLIKRGKLNGYEDCTRLHDEALKQRLREICQSRRNESGIAGRKKQAQQLRIARMKATPRRKTP